MSKKALSISAQEVLTVSVMKQSRCLTRLSISGRLLVEVTHVTCRKALIASAHAECQKYRTLLINVKAHAARQSLCSLRILAEILGLGHLPDAHEICSIASLAARRNDYGNYTSAN